MEDKRVCDVLLVVATEIERDTLLARAHERTGSKHSIRFGGRRVYYDLGMLGGAHLSMVQCEMGSGGPGASQATISDAIDDLKPHSVVMVGIAFGIDDKKQSFGQTLVSRRLHAYELQRVGTDSGGRLRIIPRGDKVMASPMLIGRLRAAQADWQGNPVSFGLMLSGEKLVDNIDCRDQLRAFAPDAIGGEMEAAGLYTACSEREKHWIVVKAICDFADGKKSEGKSEKQQEAAEQAIGFLLHAIAQGGFVRAGGEPDEFDPSVSAPASIRDPGRCLGRDEQIERLVARLEKEDGLILILGNAGNGKTTVASKAGVDPKVVRRFAARRWFVELERSATADEAVADIAEALGFDRTARLSAVKNHLAKQPALIFLDTIEKLLETNSQAIESVLNELASVRGLAMMVARRGQHTIGSVCWKDEIRVDPLTDDDGRTLFLSIARNIQHDDPHLDFFIKELDGIPLAISLVAQRASALQNLAGLQKDWLKIGTELLPAGSSRRESLLVSVEISLTSQLLKTAGHQLFSLLGQLPGSLAREDREALLGEPGIDAEEQLRLVGLLKDSDGRIGLLAPIRDISRRHHAPGKTAMSSWLSHFIDLVKHEGERVGTVGGDAALRRLLPEMANVVAAFSEAATWPHGRRNALDALVGFEHALRHTGVSGEAALTALHRSCERAHDEVGQARCLLARGRVASEQSISWSAERDFRAAQDLLQGRKSRIAAECIRGLADLLLREDWKKAKPRFEEALQLHREVRDPEGEAECLLALAEIAQNEGDNDNAEQLSRDAYEIFVSRGALTRQAGCLSVRAELALKKDDLGEAKYLYEEGRSRCRDAGSHVGEAACARGVGRIAHLEKKFDEAAALFDEARSLNRLVGSLSAEAGCDFHLGAVARDVGKVPLAKAHFHNAATLYSRAACREVMPTAFGSWEIWRYLNMTRQRRG